MTASFLDRNGRAIGGLAAAAAFLRPVRVADDTDVALAEVGGGRYSASLDLPLGGAWDVELTAEGEAGQWRSRQRLLLP